MKDLRSNLFVLALIACACAACGTSSTGGERPSQSADAAPQDKPEPSSADKEFEQKKQILASTMPGAKLVEGVEISQAKLDDAKRQGEMFLKKYGNQLVASVVTQLLVYTFDNIDKARKAFAEKRYTDALRSYLEIIAHKANDSRSLLEVAETALAKGDVEEARALAVRATYRAFDPKLAGAVYDILGRICEKAGDKERAALFYRASLDASRDEAVAGRLAALGVKGKQPPLPERIGGQYGPVGPAADLDALCELVKTTFPKRYGDMLKCENGASRVVTTEGGSITAATYLTLIFTDTESHHVVAVKNGAGWFAVAEMAYVSAISNVYTAGDKLGLSRFAFADVVPGGSKELVVDVSVEVGDCDPLVNEQLKLAAKTILICGERDKAPACFVRIPYAVERERKVLSDAFDQKFDTSKHTKPLPLKEAYELKIDLGAPGAIAVSKVKGELPPEKRSLVGKISL